MWFIGKNAFCYRAVYIQPCFIWQLRGVHIFSVAGAHNIRPICFIGFYGIPSFAGLCPLWILGVNFHYIWLAAFDLRLTSLCMFSSISTSEKHSAMIQLLGNDYSLTCIIISTTVYSYVLVYTPMGNGASCTEKKAKLKASKRWQKIYRYITEAESPAFYLWATALFLRSTLVIWGLSWDKHSSLMYTTKPFHHFYVLTFQEVCCFPCQA